MNNIPMRIMRDLGYSWEAIRACTPQDSKISAAELSDRLVDREKKVNCTDWEHFGRLIRNSSSTNPKPIIDRRRVEEETLQMVRNDFCVNCLKKPRTQLSAPCFHLMLCEDCTDVIRKCPLCNEDIDYVMQIYRS